MERIRNQLVHSDSNGSRYWPAGAVATEWSNCADESTQSTIGVCKICAWNGSGSWKTGPGKDALFQ